MTKSELEDSLRDVSGHDKFDYAQCAFYPDWETMVEEWADKPEVLDNIVKDVRKYLTGDHYFKDGVWPRPQPA